MTISIKVVLVPIQSSESMCVYVHILCGEVTLDPQI